MDWMKVIADAEKQPYVLGVHDCLRVACAVVEARTGIDHWARFKGYKTRRQAVAVIKRVAPTLRAAIGKVLGTPEILPTLAQRGDLALYRDVEDHIGVCIGAQVVVLGPEGLVRICITSPQLLAAWRVA